MATEEMEKIKKLVVLLCGISLDRDNLSKFSQVRSVVNLIHLLWYPIISTYTIILSADVPELADNLLSFFTAYFSLFSNLFYYFKRKPFLQFYQRFERLSTSLSVEEEQTIKNCGKYLSYLSKLYISMVAICMVLVQFGPGVATFYEVLTSRNVTWRLPFSMKMPPVFVNNSLTYGLNYLILVYAIFIAAVSHYNDIIYLYRSYQLKGFLIVLHQRFRNLQFDSPDFQKDFVSFIDLHNEVLGGIKEFQQGFSANVCGVFILAILSLSSSIFGIINKISLTNMLLGASFTNGTLIKLFIIVYGGSEFTMELLQLPNTIFYSNWVEGSLKVKKQLVLVLGKAVDAKPLRMGFYNVELDTFLKIIKSAFQYALILRTLTESNKM